jgi:hypothetical protein
MADLWLGSEDDEGGAADYFGPEVGQHIAAARRAIRRAERRLLTLAGLTDDPGAARWEIEQDLAEFLAWAASVRGCLDAAVKEGGDQSARRWWDALAADSELAAFTSHRHAALKRVESAASLTTVVTDGRGLPAHIAYWAFSMDPHVHDPVVPRCQKHLERLRDLLDEVSARLPRSP